MLGETKEQEKTIVINFIVFIFLLIAVLYCLGKSLTDELIVSMGFLVIWVLKARENRAPAVTDLSEEGLKDLENLRDEWSKRKV